MPDEVEPTPDEIKNGWTKETLALYIAERESAQAGKYSFDPMFRPPVKPMVANSKYNPLRWRG